LKFAKWMTKYGMSQTEVAEVLGVPQSTVSRLTTGKTPQAHTCAAIVRGTLGEVSLEDLLPDDLMRGVRRMDGRLARLAEQKKVAQKLERMRREAQERGELPADTGSGRRAS